MYSLACVVSGHELIVIRVYFVLVSFWDDSDELWECILYTSISLQNCIVSEKIMVGGLVLYTFYS